MTVRAQEAFEVEISDQVVFSTFCEVVNSLLLDHPASHLVVFSPSRDIEFPPPPPVQPPPPIR